MFAYAYKYAAAILKSSLYEPLIKYTMQVNVLYLATIQVGR